MKKSITESGGVREHPWYMMHNRRKVKHIEITWDYGNRPQSLFYCAKQGKEESDGRYKDSKGGQDKYKED